MAGRCRMPNTEHCWPRTTPLPVFALAAVLTIAAPAAGQAPVAARDPEPAVALPWAGPARTAATATSYMVAAANPLAVEAGLELLRAGGSASDAAIAVQFVLNLVEPQSSGIGGGAFALHWQASTGQLRTYDGRESAPAAAKPDRFLENGEPLQFGDAVFGGLSVGVPGTVRLLEALHKEHGKLPWAQLLAPAIRLAEQGFHVSPRLNLLLRWYGARNFAPQARAYFFDYGGSARAEGTLVKNPEFAVTLRAIAERGGDAFYNGAIAQAIVEAVRQAPSRPGDITLDDLAAYRVSEREPVCFTYRHNRICGMGPPSSGGLAVGQILKMVEGFDLGRGPADALNPRALHLIVEAQKLAFADRDHYVGDPDFVPVPGGLLDAAYLGARRRLINPETAMEKASPGTPPQIGLRMPAPMPTKGQTARRLSPSSIPMATAAS